MSVSTPTRTKPPRAPGLTVHSDVAGLAGLAPEWDALLVECAAPSLFLTHAWVSAWWDVFGTSHQLHVVSVRSESGELIGLAPLFIARGVEGYPANLRVLALLGQQGDTLAEELDVLARPGHEAEVAQALADHLVAIQSSAWDALYFERVRGDAEVVPQIEACLARAGLCAERSGTQESPYLTLPATPGDVLAGLSKNFRRQIRNARNRLAKEGNVEIAFAGTDVPVDEAMDTLIALHRKRWGPDDGSFDTDAYVRFHRALSRALHADGRLLLVLMKLDGEPVAVRYDFVFAGRIWCFQGGWDPDYERMRIGTLLTATVLEWGVEQGLAEYAFLSGDDAYKWRWTSTSRSLFDLLVWGRGARPFLARTKRRVKAGLRKLLRRQ